MEAPAATPEKARWAAEAPASTAAEAAPPREEWSRDEAAAPAGDAGGGDARRRPWGAEPLASGGSAAAPRQGWAEGEGAAPPSMAPPSPKTPQKSGLVHVQSDEDPAPPSPQSRLTGATIRWSSAVFAPAQKSPEAQAHPGIDELLPPGLTFYSAAESAEA